MPRPSSVGRKETGSRHVPRTGLGGQAWPLPLLTLSVMWTPMALTKWNWPPYASRGPLTSWPPLIGQGGNTWPKAARPLAHWPSCEPAIVIAGGI